MTRQGGKPARLWVKQLGPYLEWTIGQVKRESANEVLELFREALGLDVEADDREAFPCCRRMLVRKIDGVANLIAGCWCSTNLVEYAKALRIMDDANRKRVGKG